MGAGFPRRELERAISAACCASLSPALTTTIYTGRYRFWLEVVEPVLPLSRSADALGSYELARCQSNRTDSIERQPVADDNDYHVVAPETAGKLIY